MASILHGKATYQGKEFKVNFLCPDTLKTKEEADAWFLERCKEREYLNPELTEFGEY